MDGEELGSLANCNTNNLTDGRHVFTVRQFHTNRLFNLTTTCESRIMK